MMMKDLALLRLLQLVSSNLPVGGFTYSQGLEWACESGLVKNNEQFLNWQQQIIHDNLCYLELPLLIRLYQAVENQDLSALQHWNALLLQNRESKELRQEERQRGQALARLIGQSGFCIQSDWLAQFKRSQLSGFAWLASHWQIPLPPLLLGYAFNLMESAVLAGIKLVPFGQQAAQRLLLQLTEQLPFTVETALAVTDDDIGAGFPLMAIASSRHENQYSRLFRS